jgi:hypothetical protein
MTGEMAGRWIVSTTKKHLAVSDTRGLTERRVGRGLRRFTTVAALSLGVAMPGTAALGANASSLQVVRVTSSAADLYGVAAVVVVPPMLAQIAIPSSAWSASAYGNPLPVTTERLADRQLHVMLVLGPNHTDLTAERGAAAEFLHDLPGATHVGVVEGDTVVGERRDSALEAIGALKTDGPVSSALAAAIRVPTHRGRRAVVVFASCSGLNQAVSSVRPNRPNRELDVVGLGPGCSALGSPLAARDGVVADGHGSGDAISAAADQVANRLLGEYNVKLRAPGLAGIVLHVDEQGMRASSQPLASPAVSGNAVGRGLSGQAVIRAVGILVTLVLVFAVVVVVRCGRQPTG